MLADQASDLNLDGQGPAELTEEHFRRAFLKGPEPGTITRLSDGVFLAANDAMLAATGYSREDFIGSTGLLLGIWKNASDRAEFVSRLQREGWVNGFERKLRRKDGRVWLHQLCARIVEIGGESYVVAAGRDVTEARKREDLVLQIAAGVADSTGEKFLQSLVGHLAEALHAQLAWVAEAVSGEEPRLRTLAVYKDGRESAGFEYQPSSTACEMHGASALCIHSTEAWKLFPSHTVLREPDAEGYAAIPLLDSKKGTVLGSLGLVSHRPFSDSELASSLLRISAARAAAELERKRADEALRASEARLKILFEYAPDPYYVVDLSGAIVDANQACEELTGYKRAEVLGRNIIDLGILAPSDGPKAITRLRQSITGQATQPAEYTIVRRDGRPVQVEIRAFPIEIGGERLMLGCIRDITARKQAEAENRERHQRIQKLQAAVLHLATHPALVEGEVVRVAQCLTEKAAAILKLDRAGVWLFNSRGELAAMDEFSTPAGCHTEGAVIGAQSCPPYFEAINEGLPIDTADAKGDPRTSQLAAVRADVVSATSLLDSPIRVSGRVVGVVRYEHAGLGQRNWEPEEIQFAAQMAEQMAEALLNADRRRAELSLKKSQASLRRAQHMASLGSWELDCGTGMVEWSAEMYAIFGLSPESDPPTHERLLDAVHQDDRKRVEDAVGELLHKGVPYSVDFRIVRPDGSKRHVRERAELETDSNGTLRLIGTLQDVTEYKHLEERVQTARKLESVGRLAGGVAHDFNNLLTVINGYAGLLLRDANQDRIARVGLEEIRKAGDKAAMLTQQLLTFSRKQAVQPEVLDLNAVVGDMHRMLRRLIGEHIELTTVLEPGTAHIKADPGHINQIVMNLAVNARDSMPDGGRLIIETASVDVPKTSIDGGRAIDRNGAVAPGAYVMLAVSDTGEGMDEETRSHIFEPFFTTKETGHGTGLGMSTVYGIVEQCGGWIWVYSEPGRGTTVKVYLPRLNSDGAARPVPERSAMAGGLETVLVVEDQEEVRRLTVAVLKDCGYQVLSAANGQMALEVSEPHKGTIHLLITDAVMPGMSGRQLSDRLRHTRPFTKVLFMSGYTDNVAAYRFEVDAGHAFLQKPFDPDTLAAKVRETLGPPRVAARILVVDDEEGVRSLLRHILTDAGHEVLEASNGKEATERLQAEDVDLMITDLVMPEREGIEIILELHRTRPDLGIIAMSGAFGGQFLRAARLFGARATLSKPIDQDVLLAEIEGFLLERANRTSKQGLRP